MGEPNLTDDGGAALVASAFPWGAHVQSASGARFMSLAHRVVESDAHGAVVVFEHESGNVSLSVTMKQLADSASTGRLELQDVTVRRPETADVGLLADPLGTFIGPQSSTGDRWVRRMRLHQSWWRTFHLRVPFGTGPNRGSHSWHGNMLDLRGAEQGRNFISDDARRAYQERLDLTKVGVDEWRTARNLLASQPMAFNLFGHLRHNLLVATGLFKTLLGGDEIGEVTGIEIERLSDALGDRTAFDVFVTYVLADRTPGCIAVETKLTERFSQRAYDWQAYRNHSAFDPAVWRVGDATVLGDLRWSQLWRNHLLALAETRRFEPLGSPQVMVVHHPNDPECVANVEGYRQLLNDPRGLCAIDLATIVAALRPAVAGTLCTRSGSRTSRIAT
jgi:hypothetical protein